MFTEGVARWVYQPIQTERHAESFHNPACIRASVMKSSVASLSSVIVATKTAKWWATGPQAMSRNTGRVLIKPFLEHFRHCDLAWNPFCETLSAVVVNWNIHTAENEPQRQNTECVGIACIVCFKTWSIYGGWCTAVRNLQNKTKHFQHFKQPANVVNAC